MWAFSWQWTNIDTDDDERDDDDDNDDDQNDDQCDGDDQNADDGDDQNNYHGDDNYHHSRVTSLWYEWFRFCGTKYKLIAITKGNQYKWCNHPSPKTTGSSPPLWPTFAMLMQKSRAL